MVEARAASTKPVLMQAREESEEVNEQEGEGVEVETEEQVEAEQDMFEELERGLFRAG